MTQTKILTVSEAEVWDAAQVRRGAAFLQSSWWGGFQIQLGQTVRYLSDTNWAALVIERKTPLGSYWLIPYGPSADTPEDLIVAINELRSLASHAGQLFIRIEPKQLFDPTEVAGLRRAPHDYNPRYTLVCDLSQPEEVLHHALNSSNRSLVNQMPRNGIEYKELTDSADIDIFLDLQAEVSSRTGAAFQSSDYFKTQAKALMPTGQMRLYAAYQDGEPVAVTITHDYAGTTTYTYAASAFAARKKSVGNTIVWYAMMQARQRGQRWFDFSGVAGPDAKPDDPWLGFTYFKTKFGGQPAEYMGTWDIPLKPRYWLLRTRTAGLYWLKSLKQRAKKKS